MQVIFVIIIAHALVCPCLCARTTVLPTCKSVKMDLATPLVATIVMAKRLWQRKRRAKKSKGTRKVAKITFPWTSARAMFLRKRRPRI